MRRRLVLAVTVLVCALAGAQSAAAASPDLFFSEYIEGSSFNKALEIFNNTGTSIDLAAQGYNVQVFFNGATSATLTVNLTGTLADQDAFVVAPTNAGAAILAVADQTFGTSWFNGDDAVVLRRGTTVIDAIGQIGVDPGTEWGTGLTSTADNTLRRKTTVQTGEANGSDPFDPAVEWDGLATDTTPEVPMTLHGPMPEPDTDEPESRPGGIPLYAWVVAAALLAIPVGLAWGPGAAALKILPDLIIRALAALATPLVMLAVLSAIVTNDIRGRQGVRMMAYYLVNTVVAITMAMTAETFSAIASFTSSVRILTYSRA